MKEALCQNLKKLSNSITEKVSLNRSLSEVKQSDLVSHSSLVSGIPTRICLQKSIICEKSEKVSHQNLGQLYFKLKYNYDKQALCVTINKCTNLP